MQFDAADLRRAVEKDHVVPSYQPVVELRTGKLTGFEVLARWQHPELGPILPPGFIEFAESSGLIQQMTEQVFRRAMTQAKDMPADLMLSVNISPLQMRDPELATDLFQLASETGFALDRLIIEITESALLIDIEQAKTSATALKDYGCRLALDDFGTGYSSLTQLLMLPFDELKVDRSFVSSMIKSKESRKIVASIVGLALSLGLSTVAEGVETEEQADMLLWLGCDQGQGWLYGKPMLSDQLAGAISPNARYCPAKVSSPGEGWAASTLEALPTQRLAQLQAIYDGAPVGLGFLDRDLRYISLNRRLATMNGASVRAHIGKTPREMAAELFPIVEPYLRIALTGEGLSNFEVSAPARQGKDDGRTLRLSYEPAWNESDEVIGISIVVEDITVQRQNEEALRQIADQESCLIALSGQVPWIMDKDGNSIQTSAEWARSHAQAKGLTRHLGWLESLHVDDLEPTMRQMKRALETGEPIDIQYRVQNVDGQWTWMRSRGTPRFNAKGEIVRWYGLVEELTSSERLLTRSAA